MSEEASYEPGEQAVPGATETGPLLQQGPISDAGLPDITADDSANQIWAHRFMIGDIGLLLASNVVSEVADDLAFCRLPNTPAWFQGMVNQHGTLVPVFDFHRLFGMPPNDKAKHYLIIGQREMAAAIMIEQLPERIVLHEDDRSLVNSELPEIIEPYVRSCFMKDGQLLVEWAIQDFFSKVGEQL